MHKRYSVFFLTKTVRNTTSTSPGFQSKKIKEGFHSQFNSKQNAFEGLLTFPHQSFIFSISPVITIIYSFKNC